MTEEECWNCRAAVLWARTEGGCPIRLDADPVPAGGFILRGMTAYELPEPLLDLLSSNLPFEPRYRRHDCRRGR